MNESMSEGEIPLAGQLHRAMRDFVASAARRRNLPDVLHVGHPAGEVVPITDQDWYDEGTRADLVTRALDGLATTTPLAWLTRVGELTTTSTDLSWCAAVRTGFDRHGLTLPGVYLLTRRGWAELISGEQHPWHRVRPARYID